MKNADYQTAVRLTLNASTKLQRDIANAFLEKPDHRFLHKDLADRLRIRSGTLNAVFGKLGHHVYKIRHPEGSQPPNSPWSSELVHFKLSDDGWIYIARKKFIDALASKNWLVFWNPTKNHEDDIPALIASGEEFRWSTGHNRHKVPQRGDRFFFVRVGSDPRGIVGYGMVISSCEKGEYWNEESKLATTLYFRSRFTSHIVDRTLTFEQLKRLNLTHQTWGYQGCVLELENPRDYERIRTAFDQLEAESTSLAEEFETAGFIEGERKLLREHLVREPSRALVEKKKRLELGRTGRLACEHCGFDFRTFYGEIGEGYIQAHHKRPIAELKRARKSTVDDLELVCGNCHSMLHRGLKGAQLRRLLDARKRSK